MLEAIAWVLVVMFAIPVLGFVITTFVVALTSTGHSRYNDEDDAYVVMPDGTVRFDTGG